MSRVFDDMTEFECIKAKSWVDELLHKAPQTKDFFDKNTELKDIVSRHDQKLASLEQGVTTAAERCKSFVKSNVQDIQNIRGQFNILAQYGLRNGCTNMNAVLSPKTIKNYIEFREQQVQRGELKISSFRTICSDMRILAYFATATPQYRNVDVTQLTTRAYERAKEYVEQNNPYDKGVEGKAYTAEEYRAIMDNFPNEKMAVAVELSYEQGLRLENVATVFIDTRWERQEDRSWQRVHHDGTIALVSKGTQRHTITINNPQVLDGLRKYADENGLYSCSRRGLENALRDACHNAGVAYKHFHGLRYSFANRSMEELTSAGVDYRTAKLTVSSSMFHKREEITDHYLGKR